MKKTVFLTLVMVVGMLFSTTTFAQETTEVDTVKAKIEAFVSVDLVSQYVWRGFLFEDRPNVQPVFGLAYKNLEVGIFNSKSLSNPYYELDLFLSYSPMSWLNFTATDFFFDYSDFNQLDYFEYRDTVTHHNVLADITIGDSEKFPLTATVSTIVYGGYDLDADLKSKYTTYVELDYYYKDFQFFVGALTGQSDFYMNTEDKFGVVNVGLKYSKEVKINDNVKLPITTSFGVNPQMKKTYFTIGITL